MKYVDQNRAEKVRQRLYRLYEERADRLLDRLLAMIGQYGTESSPKTAPRWSQEDLILITYADMVLREGEPPLRTLRRFLTDRLRDVINTVHILPFCPWSSDDGFAVIDYREVAPEYGTWKHVDELGEDFHLMFDMVLNHCSAENPWFRDFLTGIAPARHYFHEVDPERDLSQVVRPRPWPLLTKTRTRGGETYVWTTFSADQVDLNWQNPDVLFEFLDILFLYISHSARIIRLDAIAFLWKEIGTNCLHLPKTHEVVKLIRDILEWVAPEALILTETNVPHEENISYFGDGDEAHMVYQFTLPPLLLHALLKGDASYLKSWASALPELPKGCCFFNFTSSHDGIGLRPLEGILPPQEFASVIEEVSERGGLISTRSNAEGGQSPYELNASYFASLSESADPALGIDRFLCSQAVALSLQGVPAIYFHSLTATPNYHEGVKRTGQNRTINRRKWQESELNVLLDDHTSTSAQVFQRYAQMIRCRRSCEAFHPNGGQKVLDTPDHLFGFLRTSPKRDQEVLCLFNVTSVRVRANLTRVYPPWQERSTYEELLRGKKGELGPRSSITLNPYQACWLVAS